VFRPRGTLDGIGSHDAAVKPDFAEDFTVDALPIDPAKR
jgi:hypothetical protein